MEKSNFTIKYGSGTLNVTLPGTDIKELIPTDITPIENIETAINHALDNPIGAQPFNKIFFPGDKVLIVASDVTRVVNLHLFLPGIVCRLNSIGISDKDIMVLIALGTHRAQTEAEMQQIVGQEIYARVKVVNHDCDNDLVNVGSTSFGTELAINRLAAERKVILTGSITHHLMAGFGGGRKSIVPGIAGRNTVFQNHSHALDPHTPRSNPLIGVGTTKQNPINLDMIECAELVSPDFLINVVSTPDGKPAKFFAGHWHTAWRQGCQWADEQFGVPITQPADLVIASCGGYPKDISLYQATKTLFNANLAVASGGTILLVAECPEGAGANSFFGWVNPLTEGKLDQELRKNFTIAGYIFYAAVEVAKNAKVILLSNIEPELVRPMGISATSSLDRALELINANKLRNRRTVFMPFGGSTIPYFAANDNK